MKGPKKFLTPNFCGPKKNFDPKNCLWTIFGSKIHLNPNFILDPIFISDQKKFSDPKFLRIQKIFRTRNVLLTNNFFDPIFFWSQIFFAQIFFWPKFFLTQNFFDPKSFLTKFFFYPEFFQTICKQFNQSQTSLSLPWAWHSSAPACFFIFPLKGGADA